MASYIIRRVLLMVPTLLGISLVVFVVMAASPGGIGPSLLGDEGSMKPQERARMEAYYNKRFGLNLPWYRQYGRWLNNISPVGFYDATAGEGAAGVDSGAGSWRWGVEWRVLKPPGEAGADGGVDGGAGGGAGGGPVERQGFGLKTPDLGTSFLRDTPVLDVVLAAIPPTLTLNLISIPIIYLIAVTTGIYAGRYHGRAFDVTSGTIFLGLWSLPTMWVGVMLLMFLANRDAVQWFPLSGLHSPGAEEMAFFPFRDVSGAWNAGWLLDLLWHLILPVACLSYGGFAVLSKLMRASVLENMQTDFVRTARAKGLTEHAILYRHVLRNSVLPLITVAAGILPGCWAGRSSLKRYSAFRAWGC